MMDYDADHRLATRVGKLRRHWRWIVGGAGACAGAALLVSLFSPKIYRATTYIMVSESKIGSGSGDTPWQQMATLPTFVPFVDNDALIRESLEKFHLDRPPYNLTAERFRRRGYLDVQIPKSTRLLEVDIEFPNARLAADFANDLAKRAVQFNDRMNAADTSSTRDFLKKQLEEATERLTKAAAQRLKIQQEAHMEDREKELSILLAEKERLSTHLEQLRLALAQDQSRTKALKQALAGQPRTYELKKSVTADRFLERAVEKMNLSGAPLSMTEESLNATRETIQQDLVKATVDAAAEMAGSKEAEARLGEVGRQISRLLAQITALRNDLERAEQNYSLAYEAVKRASHEYQNASVTVTSKSQDLKQVAPAIVPERPVRPRTVLNTLLGFILGGMLFVSLALIIENVREMRHSGLFSLEEVEQIVAKKD
ncbi:MAG TPA: Wzz/FepE/Etk N-terminal domain-containing protein [Terriglobia bacterium]|nr:Wzz/FepE/Etk N-terminal domain-containing protein [Terriglobia bacterium]